MGKNEIGTYIILLNMIQYQLEINEHSWYKHLFKDLHWLFCLITNHITNVRTGKEKKT
jgi:hypothetical protein